MPPPKLKPSEKSWVVSTQRAFVIVLIMLSVKVTSAPPELAQPLLRPSGATKMALLLDRLPSP
jgi:hypothetical protein